MKKRSLKSLLALGMSFALLVGCQSQGSGTAGSQNTGSNGTNETKGSGSAIRLVNGKIEIDTQLKEIAKKYQEKTGQEVIIESMGGGVDISGQLKSYFAADNMPDMFVIGGDGDYANWSDKVADLSDCAFAKDTDFNYKDAKTGKVVGFPYAVEGYGITYNAEILEKAGIDPKSLINYEAYKNAFEKLDSMKEELGIVAVNSVAAETSQMFWSTGNHILGYYYTGGLERGDHKYFDEAMAGKFDKARLDQFADFVGLLFKYSDPKVLISGTYDDQLALWAQGKTAFITQGNWIDPSLPTYKAEFKCGIAPLAFTKENMDRILADCPSYWCVYKDGKNVQACKDFLDFLATTEEGQTAMVKDAGMISPYKSSTIVPTAQLALSLKEYVDAGKTSSWDWVNLPEGIAQNAFGLVFETYAKGEVNKEQFVDLLQTSLTEYLANK